MEEKVLHGWAAPSHTKLIPADGQWRGTEDAIVETNGD